MTVEVEYCLFVVVSSPNSLISTQHRFDTLFFSPSSCQRIKPRRSRRSGRSVKNYEMREKKNDKGKKVTAE